MSRRSGDSLDGNYKNRNKNRNRHITNKFIVIIRIWIPIVLLCGYPTKVIFFLFLEFANREIS